VDSPDDPQVTQAARIAVNLYNRQSDDMYMYSVVKVISAESQVVAGVIYYLDVETVRCMKRQSPHMESCPQSDKTETFVCHFELLEVPWENSNQLLKVQCRPSVPKVSASALLGGITPLSPDTPRVQQLAQYAVNQYRLDGQDKYTYSMIKVLSAQEQVVNGLLYYLQVLMGECVKESAVCTANSSSKTLLCHFTLWQQAGRLGELQSDMPFSALAATVISVHHDVHATRLSPKASLDPPPPQHSHVRLKEPNHRKDMEHGPQAMVGHMIQVDEDRADELLSQALNSISSSATCFDQQEAVQGQLPKCPYFPTSSMVLHPPDECQQVGEQGQHLGRAGVAVDGVAAGGQRARFTTPRMVYTQKLIYSRDEGGEEGEWPSHNHGGHELLQEGLLLLIVLELVADEHQSFHQGALLHLGEQQLIGKELLHVAVEHVKAWLWCYSTLQYRSRTKGPHLVQHLGQEVWPVGDERKEGGHVGEDAGKDQGVPCLIAEHGLQQLNALVHWDFLREGEGQVLSSCPTMLSMKKVMASHCTTEGERMEQRPSAVFAVKTDPSINTKNTTVDELNQHDEQALCCLQLQLRLTQQQTQNLHQATLFVGDVHQRHPVDVPCQRVERCNANSGVCPGLGQRSKRMMPSVHLEMKVNAWVSGGNNCETSLCAKATWWLTNRRYSSTLSCRMVSRKLKILSMFCVRVCWMSLRRWLGSVWKVITSSASRRRINITSSVWDSWRGQHVRPLLRPLPFDHFHNDSGQSILDVAFLFQDKDLKSEMPDHWRLGLIRQLEATGDTERALFFEFLTELRKGAAGGVACCTHEALSQTSRPSN
ncbi:cystatin-M-like, partial [Scleropages formosus]